MILTLQIGGGVSGGIVVGLLFLFAICTAPERYRRWKEKRLFAARDRRIRASLVDWPGDRV